MCDNCLGDFPFEELAVRRGHLLGVAVASYGAREQRVLHAFKENGQTSLVRFLAEPLGLTLQRLAENTAQPLLVPVPSSRANYKKRGFMPINLLGKRVCRASGQAFEFSDSLRFRRIVADQAHLDSESRRANLAGSMMADARLSGRQVVLFDDVVTTGSSILEADRAVTAAGGIVLGFLAFAETILKTHSKS